MILQSRRSLIVGMASLLAAPAIVRVSSLMPVKVVKDYVILPWYNDVLPETVEYVGEIRYDYINFMKTCNDEMFKITGIDNVRLRRS